MQNMESSFFLCLCNVFFFFFWFILCWLIKKKDNAGLLWLTHVDILMPSLPPYVIYHSFICHLFLLSISSAHKHTHSHSLTFHFVLAFNFKFIIHLMGKVWQQHSKASLWPLIKIECLSCLLVLSPQHWMW